MGRNIRTDEDNWVQLDNFSKAVPEPDEEPLGAATICHIQKKPRLALRRVKELLGDLRAAGEVEMHLQNGWRQTFRWAKHDA